jgi:hypothetical protein
VRSAKLAFAAVMLAPFALAACGERAEEGAPPPAEMVSATPAESDAAPAAPTVLDAADLRRVCRAGLAGIHGQRLEDVTIDGLEGETVNASWRAPVDGGRRRARCRVEGDLVTWKPVEAPTPEENRWMNQSGDPVTRFVLDGEAITINTTLPDGTTATETYAVATEQEAR